MTRKMRMIGTLTLAGLLATSSLAVQAQEPADDTAADGAAVDGAPIHVYSSDDGLLTIEVPVDGAPPDIRAIWHPPEDRPPELADVPARSGFYELLPDGLQFTDPVTIRRTISITDSGFDVDEDGVPLIPLALRTSDGTWSWLEEQVVDYELGSDTIIVSGKTSHFSSLFALGGTAFNLLGFDADLQAAVDAATSVQVELREPAPLGAHVRAIAGFTLDPTIAVPGSGEVSNEILGVQPFKCVGPGSTAFTVMTWNDNLGADLPIFADLGLEGVMVDLHAHGTVDCQATIANAIAAIDASCFRVVHEPFREFISFIEALFATNPRATVTITMRGANNDETLTFDANDVGLAQIRLGLAEAGRKRIVSVTVALPGEAPIDVTSQVIEDLGGRSINVPFPGEPEFGQCDRFVDDDDVPSIGHVPTGLFIHPQNPIVTAGGRQSLNAFFCDNFDLVDDEKLLERLELEIRELLSEYEFPGDELPEAAFEPTGLDGIPGTADDTCSEASDGARWSARGRQARQALRFPDAKGPAAEVRARRPGSWQIQVVDRDPGSGENRRARITLQVRDRSLPDQIRVLTHRAPGSVQPTLTEQGDPIDIALGQVLRFDAFVCPTDIEGRPIMSDDGLPGTNDDCMPADGEWLTFDPGAALHFPTDGSSTAVLPVRPGPVAIVQEQQGGDQAFTIGLIDPAVPELRLAADPSVAVVMPGEQVDIMLELCLVPSDSWATGLTDPGGVVDVLPLGWAQPPDDPTPPDGMADCEPLDELAEVEWHVSGSGYTFELKGITASITAPDAFEPGREDAAVVAYSGESSVVIPITGATEASCPEDRLVSDLDGDGFVSLIDVRLLVTGLRAGQDTTDDGVSLDLDGDGQVTVADVQLAFDDLDAACEPRE